MVQHILSSADVGNQCVKTFVEKCLVKQETSVFDKITKNQLNTDIQKPSATTKSVEALTEDVHGVYVCPTSVLWIYNVGQFVHSMVSESTWQTFFDKLLKKIR